jgi:alpha-amylase
MTKIAFYFQVHQPVRLRRIQGLRPTAADQFWDDATNRRILERAADRCYLPANQAILDLIRETDGAFRCAFSITGTFLEQAMAFRPDVIDSFRELARTGRVEFLAETYYHSLAALWQDSTEFEYQVRKHGQAMRRLLGVTPRVFRNTELIYDDRIARLVERLGYEAILTEGTERVLGSRSPNVAYQPDPGSRLKILLKNYRLSDDIAFRFSARDWPEYPLDAEKFARWLASTPGESINLFMDYETFGEHQHQETGIFEFLRALPRAVARYPHLGFAQVHEVARQPARDTLSVPQPISWADTERDVSAWLHNRMQRYCFDRLQRLTPRALAADGPLAEAWRRLQTSDHLYYCTTKMYGDQDIHSYFSPYESPYLAFINFKNAIDQLSRQLPDAPSREIVTIPQQRPLVAATRL